MKPVCIQINWQRQLGGGEIYTRFFTQALQSLGWDVHLVVDRKADFWGRLGLDGVRYFPIGHGDEIPRLLTAMDSAVVITHTTLSAGVAQAVAARHRLGGIVHMPLANRDPRGLSCYHRIFAVSAYVRATVEARGHANIHAEPLLGVADLKPREGSVGPVIRRSEYDWDKRKFRDWLLSWCAPLDGMRARQEFARRPGLTLGIVSRLTPIKQFPLLFSHLTPILAASGNVNLEIFGSGGYASVRDLRSALAPLGDRVRFWGHQADPAAIYPLLDYVMSGLPEREALGLNLIEAQVAGTPVIAVNAPPFVETVADGQSGFLYTDPRTDEAASFSELLAALVAGKARPDPRLARLHMARFSADAFRERVAGAMTSLAA